MRPNSSKPDNLLIKPPNQPAWKLALREFFARPSVEIVVGVLVLISVGLTLFELWLDTKLAKGVHPLAFGWGPLNDYHLHLLQTINDFITGIFVVELSLRFVAASSKRRYFTEFWLDILATIPLFRVFRGARVLRLLRLGRLLRLLGIMTRLSTHFPWVFRRGAINFLMICTLLLMAIVFGTVAMTHFEKVPQPADAQAGVAADNTSGFDMENSFWFSIYTLFAGEPIPRTPETLSGKIVTVFLMFMGLTIFAIFAGTVSAFMVDRLRLEGRIVYMDDLRNHIVICGWTPKTEVIVREYRSNKATRSLPIVVISELERDKIDADTEKTPNLHLIHDDFTKVSALNRAGIGAAKICLVLADTTGGRSEQDADARTILSALTVEKMNPDVYTCAELFNRSYSTHLDEGHVNEYVISGEYGAFMIAQAGMHRGLIGVLGELLTYQEGNEFFRQAIPTSWEGCSFDDKLIELKTSQNAILVAVHTSDGNAHVNPEKYKFKVGDEVVAICKGTLELA